MPITQQRSYEDMLNSIGSKFPAGYDMTPAHLQEERLAKTREKFKGHGFNESQIRELARDIDFFQYKDDPNPTLRQLYRPDSIKDNILSLVVPKIDWFDKENAKSQTDFLKKEFGIDPTKVDTFNRRTYNLTNQILGQGLTEKWTGGDPTASARGIASQLAAAGIGDIKEFGRLPQGYGGMYGNIKTNQSLGGVPSMMGGDQYFGKSGNANFAVAFGKDGQPYFYTEETPKSSKGDFLPIVSLALSVFAPGLGTAIGAALGASGVAASVIGNAIVQGTLAEAGGGDFADGAIKGAISAGVAPTVSATIGSTVANAMADSAFKNIVTNAVTSSATSAITAGLSGGDVEKAALAGALAGAGGAAGQELGISAQYGTDAFSEQTKALLAQEQGMGGVSQLGGTLGVAAGRIAAGGDAEQILTSTLINTVTQGITDTLKTTVNTALKNPSAIVADSGEQDQGIEVPGSNGLMDLINGPSTQLASTDDDAALQAIENARKNQQSSESDIFVIPGENGTQLVIDGNGNIVDMIPSGVDPALELDKVDTTQVKQDQVTIPPGPSTGTSALDVLGQPMYPTEAQPSEDLLKIKDILNTPDGSQIYVDQYGQLADISNPVDRGNMPVDETAPELQEGTEFQGPMGPMTEDKIKRYNDEFARYLDFVQAGEPPPPDYGVQDLGITTENWESFNQNLKNMMDEGRLPSQWKADEEGNYTYVDDDGSTLTIGPTGEIVHYTESPEGYLPGETPAQEPAKQPAAQPATQPAATGPSLDWGQLLKNAAGMGAVVAGGKAIGDLLTDDNQQGQTQPTAPRTKLQMDWNQADIQAPVNGIAYGQQYFNPVFTEVTAAEGGLMSLAGGGMLGSYSDGGRLLRGPGDGMSDNIPASIAGKRPARLADGEFVIPADVVSHLGNGSTEAGSKVLYKMMERIRKARTGNPKQGKQINPSKFMPK